MLVEKFFVEFLVNEEMFVDFLIEEKYNKYFYDENSNYSGLNIEMFVLRNGYYNDEEYMFCK